MLSKKKRDPAPHQWQRRRLRLSRKRRRPDAVAGAVEVTTSGTTTETIRISSITISLMEPPFALISSIARTDHGSLERVGESPAQPWRQLRNALQKIHHPVPFRQPGRPALLRQDNSRMKHEMRITPEWEWAWTVGGRLQAGSGGAAACGHVLK